MKTHDSFEAFFLSLKNLPMFSIGGSGAYVKCEAFLDSNEHIGLTLGFPSRLSFIKEFIFKNS